MIIDMISRNSKVYVKKMQNTGIGFIKIKTLDLPINGAYYTSKSLMRKHL